MRLLNIIQNNQALAASASFSIRFIAASVVAIVIIVFGSVMIASMNYMFMQITRMYINNSILVFLYLIDVAVALALFIVILLFKRIR